MQGTPDLSKIINLIMQNPQLIQEISELASSDEANEATTPTPVGTEEVLAPADEPKRDMRSHRHELLSAMKPYLSEKRRGALDSMESILDIIDVMIKK
jgi:hypothetical protein